MASLVLGLAGAAVGSFFGPLGASVGWGIGAAIGGRLFAKGQEGPRLTDLRVQNSAYGSTIPIGYGTIRISGNVIWSADLVESKHKSSGKGSPKITTYSYSCSFAVGLCEGPIIGILRIWADSRLIYGNDGSGTQIPITIYYGTEDQLPDPTIEAKEGAGNVPAHRGTAYVVFTDLQLGEFGNRIPNLTFEIVASGAIKLEYYAHWAVDYDYPVNASVYSYPYSLNGIETASDGTLILNRYRSGDAYGPTTGTGTDGVIYFDRQTFDLNGNLLTTDAQIEVAGASGEVLGSLNSSIAYARWQVSIDCFGNGVIEFNTFGWIKDGAITYTPQNLCEIGVTDLQLPIQAAPVYWNGNVYASGFYVGQDTFIRRWPAPDGAVYTPNADIVGINASSYETGYPTTSLGSDAGDIIIGDDGYLYWLVGYYAAADGTRLFKLDADLNYVMHWHSTGLSVPFPTAGDGSSVIWRGHLVHYYSSGGISSFRMIRLNSDGTATAVDSITYAGSDVGIVGASPLHYIGNDLAAFRGGILSLGTRGVPLSEIVGDVSDRVGYASSEYDVSALTDIVRGYTISQRMAGRAAIEALQPAYQFGAVESNQQAKFVKWGGEIVATVTADDLGAHPAETDPVDPIATTRTQEVDLPRVVNVVYLNVDMDYQEGTQISQRTASPSDLSAAINLPIVLKDAEAKAMADVLLFNAWMERDKFSFQLARKWSHLEPTDVIDLDGHAVRITNKDEQGYTHIAFDGLATRTGVFIAGPVAVAPIGFVPQATPSLDRTDMVLLDLPLISDADYPNGYYAAIAGRTGETWPGAAIFKSVDGGVNYDSIASTVDQETFGIATSALDDWTGDNVFDYVSSVTVRLSVGSGDLSSSTELGVLNGSNAAALSNEILQFVNAVLISARTYRLSGFLRGRRGTEWAIAGHAVNDVFVLLPTLNINGPIGEVGQTRLFKAVTQGQALASATAQTFTNQGIALRPYAPAQLGGGPDGSGNVTLNWVRRTRIGGAWADSIDCPLSESSEVYIVQIWDVSYTLCARTITVNAAQTTVYTSAMQTTDFGAQQQHIYWTVAQLGAVSIGSQAYGVVYGSGGSDVNPSSPIAPYAFPITYQPVPGPTRTQDHTFSVPHDTVIVPISIGEKWSGKFTTAGGSPEGAITVAEYIDSSAWKHCWIASDSGGLVKISGSEAYGSTVTSRVGGSFGVTLSGSTVYYFFFEFVLANGALSGPAGTSAESIVSFNVS